MSLVYGANFIITDAEIVEPSRGLITRDAIENWNALGHVYRVGG